MNKTPSIGDTVAFVIPRAHEHAGEIIPATVTNVTGDNIISLSPSIIFHPSPAHMAIVCSGVEFAELPADGIPEFYCTWHWPAPAAVAPTPAPAS